jgi:hypothetical protein
MIRPSGTGATVSPAVVHGRGHPPAITRVMRQMPSATRVMRKEGMAIRSIFSW